MTVYTFDSGMHTVVKIEKHQVRDKAVWCVYRLEKVILTDKHPRFIFEQKPCKSWSYQPFEDKDVKGDLEVFLEDIKRWQPHLVCH